MTRDTMIEMVQKWAGDEISYVEHFISKVIPDEAVPTDGGKFAFKVIFPDSANKTPLTLSWISTKSRYGVPPRVDFVAERYSWTVQIWHFNQPGPDPTIETISYYNTSGGQITQINHIFDAFLAEL